MYVEGETALGWHEGAASIIVRPDEGGVLEPGHLLVEV